MAAASLLMRFDAPMQSWGVRSRFNRRDTLTEPSKSAVVGLLAAAQGKARDDDAAIEKLAGLRMGVRVEREGVLEVDYHTVQDVPSTKGDKPQTVQSYRYYLADALFLVAVQGPEQQVRELHQALLRPFWPLYFGRRSFVPAGPIVEPGDAAIRPLAIDELLRTHPWGENSSRHRSAARKALDDGTPLRLRTVADADIRDPGAELRYDHPVSFRSTDRRYAARAVLPGTVPVTPTLLGDKPYTTEETP